MKTKRSIGAITVMAVITAWAGGCGKRTAVSQNTAPEPPPNKSATAEPAPAAHTNRLIREKSPYLLQHAHNPVDWYPWGQEAFAKAKRENKPIFLSVGYSTCYWCHVMEKESFEDAEVAKVMNEHFVAIKVDREERPDVDEQYMLATQLVTGRGGWPNSVWLTPDGKPWMAGTYFPKPQFMSVLTQLADVWKKRRADVDKQAAELAGAIAKAGNAPAPAGVELNSKLVDQAVRQIASRFDPRAGGFGGAPKFPPHGALELLIRQYRDNGDKALLTPITNTLDAMWLGGMHDHIGGGFHRYSTDARWLLPHFEKMLYDNAQLTRTYTDGYLVAGHARYRDAVEDIFRWVQREMTSPQGAFYSAIDSGEVGKEGETYVWRTDQIEDVLGKDDAALFAKIYNFEKGGNFTEQATGERPGSNIPHLTQPIAALAQENNSGTAAALPTRLAQMREKLLARRITWPQPHKDDKVLTSWNGLMIGSLAHAGRQLKEPRYTVAAARAADFILQTMMPDGTLLRSYRDGEAKLPGYLDDYAYFAQGLVALHRATGERRWLEQADRLAAKLVADFQDQQNGGFYFTTASHEDLIMRSKSLGGGGNMPDANGVAVEVLLDLARLADRPAYLAAAKRTLTSLAGLMQQSPHSTEHLLLATADFLRTPAPQSAEKREPSATVASADATQRVGPVSIRSYVSRLSVKPGETLHVAVALDIDDGWHLYGQNPGTDFLVPSTVSVESSASFIAGEIYAPDPHEAFDAILKQNLNIYTGRIWFRLAVTASSKAKPGAATLALNVKTQACDDSRCLPPESTALRIPIQIDPDAPSDTRHPEIFTTSVQTAAASPENLAQANSDAATAWEQLRAAVAKKLNNPADARKAVDEILADLLRFAETHRGTEESTAALFNHGMLAQNIGQDEAAERSLRRAAREATAPQLAIEIAMQLKQLAIRPGKAPPDFTAPTLAGGKVSAKDFHGRVLLLDFWATWCGPCIAELPNVQQVYRDHHEAGFDILSISLDREKAALTDFLKEHALPWTHVFDADLPRESGLAVQYGVDAIPRMILIGRDGKIIGLNLRGPALAKAVANALSLPGIDGKPDARKD